MTGKKTPNTTPSFITGFGSEDSHAVMLSTGKTNTSPKAGKPYTTVTFKEIAKMVEAPDTVAKEAAQWFIPSTYHEHDGRTHDVQRQNGQFQALTGDLDCNDLPITEVIGTLRNVIGHNTTFMVYSSRSAKAKDKKWRVLVPLKEAIAGVDFADTQLAFFGLMTEESLGTAICDQALARTGQCVYLPNKGEFYEHHIMKGKLLDLTADHAIIEWREAERAELAKVKAEAMAWRERKKANAPTTDTASIVEAFNSANTIEQMLLSCGYTNGGDADWRSEFQTSGSFATRDWGEYWTSLSDSDANEGLGEESATGHRYGDAFDLFVKFEHGGDFKAAVKAYAIEVGLDHKTKKKEAAKEAITVAKVGNKISKAAEDLVVSIVWTLRQKFPDLKEDPFVDVLIVQSMIKGSFWSGSKGKLFLLNESEGLVQFSANEAWKFLSRRYGLPINYEEVFVQVYAAHCEANGIDPEEKELSAALKDKIAKAIHSATVTPIVDYIKYENQRDSMEWTVDMFASQPRMVLKENVVRIVLTHRPLQASGLVNPAHVADYLDHFPLFDELLRFIVASRFTLDRKKSYMWLLAASDWGKGFFMGVLNDLGVVVEMSVKEIEGVFEGKPAGKAPEHFKRAMVLAVDEFKTVKSELKQLQNTVPLVPKFQLQSTVEIYTKLFMSAENVDSLVGEAGVEDQFANRLSVIMGKNTLDGRPVYEEDHGAYYRSIRAHTAQRMNALISEYQALGRSGSEKRASDYLNEFIAVHGLGTHFSRLSDNIADIAAECIAWVRDKYVEDFTFNGRDPEPLTYLMHASKAVSEFIEETYDHSEKFTIKRRKKEIMVAMSEDGKGNSPHRITQGRASHKVVTAVTKAVKLKP